MNVFQTDAWVQRKLGEVADIFDGTHQTPKYTETGVMFLSVEDITTLHSEKFISIEDFEKEFKNFPVRGDILMTRIGDIGTANVVRTDKKIAYYVSLALLKPKEIDSDFIATIISSDSVKTEMWQRTLHVAFPKKINLGEISKVALVLPKDRPEQTAIGNFFHSLDNTITLHKRKLDRFKELKMAYLQQMFPQSGESVPRLRFAGFVGDWEVCKLGNIAEFNPRSVVPNSFEYVDLESVVGTSLISYRTENKETAPSRAQRLAKKGDVFFQTVRPYQMNNYLFELPFDNFVFSTGYAQLRPQIDSYFLLCKLQEKNFVTKVLDRCTGTSYPAINSTDLAEIDIGIAYDEAEQIAVGSFFRNLDKQITTQQAKLDRLKQLKQAYLQKMFV